MGLLRRKLPDKIHELENVTQEVKGVVEEYEHLRELGYPLKPIDLEPIRRVEAMLANLRHEAQT